MANRWGNNANSEDIFLGSKITTDGDCRHENTGKPGMLQSMGSQRVGHDWVTEQQQIYRSTKAEGVQRTDESQSRQWKDTLVLCRVIISSVAQLHVTLCDPMDCSMPRSAVHHQLPELAQTHIHWVGHTVQPSRPLLSPSPPAFNRSQHQGLFKWVSSSHQVTTVLELQLQHQSFQRRVRIDFL